MSLMQKSSLTQTQKLATVETMTELVSSDPEGYYHASETTPDSHTEVWRDGTPTGGMGGNREEIVRKTERKKRHEGCNS